MIFELLSSSCFSQNWVKAYKDDNISIEVDFSSIDRIDNKIYVWEKSNYLTKESRDKHIKDKSDMNRWIEFDHDICYVVYEIVGRRSQLLSSISYTKNGEIIESHDWKEVDDYYSRIIPGSIGMVLFEFLNSKYQFEVNGKKYAIPVERIGKFIERYPDAIAY